METVEQDEEGLRALGLAHIRESSNSNAGLGGRCAQEEIIKTAPELQLTSKPRMSTHEDFTPRDTGLGPSDRSFGTVFTIFFAVLAFWPAFHAKPIRWPLLLISAT